MAFVMLALAIGLTLVAYRSTDRAVKIFLGFFALLNAIGAVQAIYTDHPYAFKLMPNEAEEHESLRR